MFLFNRTTLKRVTWIGLGLGVALLLGACSASAEVAVQPDAVPLDPLPHSAEVLLGDELITFSMYLCESEPGSFSAVGNNPGSEGSENFPNDHFAFDWIRPDLGEENDHWNHLFVAHGDDLWDAEPAIGKGSLSWDRDGDMVWGTATMHMRDDASQTTSLRFATHCPGNVG